MDHNVVVSELVMKSMHTVSYVTERSVVAMIYQQTQQAFFPCFRSESRIMLKVAS